MYSQCPKCQAIFSVSESDLGAHRGLVRCGHCQSVFHAVMNEVGDVQVPAGDTDSGIDASQAGLFDVVDEGRAPNLSGIEASVPDSDQAEEDRDDESPDEGSLGEEDQARGVVEPVPSESGVTADPAKEEKTDWPGEIVEEILIEAPPVLWNAFDEEEWDESKQEDSRARDAGDTAPRTGGEGATGDTGRPARPSRTGRRTPPKSPYWARDIRMVELPRPRPFKAATLTLMTLLLVVLLAWQVKAFYLDELAQVPMLRPHLEWICRPLGCVLPPRRSFAQVDLVGTSIDVNPEIPGALEIKASLINRAHFPQPYPPLRVTLTDREGRIVGQRTYLPSEYRVDDGRELLPIREARDVSINLAQPAENAVGYEVELITPVQGG